MQDDWVISQDGCRRNQCLRIFALSLTIKQVRLQLTSSDRRTHTFSSLSNDRAAIVKFAALPASMSPVHTLHAAAQLLLATYL